MKLSKPLVVTAGEPAGIGPELCNALADSPFADDIVIVGDRRLFDNRLRIIDMPFPVGVNPGKPSSANAETLLEGLTTAAEGCMKGDFGGMVTAPLSKRVIADSGVEFTGHTEYLAAVTNTALPVMMLVAGDLRVALASTHIPLREVADYLTAERLQQVLQVLHTDLRDKFGIESPEIVVCGLNPHAGEEGLLGSEETDFISPAIDQLREQGLNLRGPLSADTAFTPAAGHKDAVLAMYHDQGLPVLKYA